MAFSVLNLHVKAISEWHQAMTWVYDKFENNVGNQNLGLLMHLVSYFTTILYIIYEYIQQISGSYIVKLKRYYKFHVIWYSLMANQ